MATPVREEVQMRGSAIPGANRLSEGAFTVSSGGFGGGGNFYHSKSPPTSPQRDPRRSPLTIVQQGQPCDGFSQLFSAILNPLDSKESIAQYSPKSPSSPQAWGPRSSCLSPAERGGEGQRSVVSFSYIEKAHVRRVDSPLSARRRTAASFTANSPSLRRSAEGSPLASSTHLRKRLSTPIYLYSPDSSCNSSPALSHRGSGSRQVNSGPCSIVKTTNHLASEELGSPVVKRRASKGPGDHLRQQSRCQSWAGTSAPVCSAGPSPTTYLGGPSKNHPSSPTTFRPSLATPSTFIVNKSQEVQIPQKQLRVKGGPLNAPLLDKRVNLSQSDSFSSAGRGINQLSGSRTASPIDSPIIARRLTNEFAVTSKDFREARKLPSPSSQGDHLEPCSPNLGQRGQKGALGSHLAVMNIPVDSVPEANSPVGAERDKPFPIRETESRGRDTESTAPPARQPRFTVYPSIKDPRRQKLCIEDTDSLTLLRHKLPQNMVENWVPSPTHELTTRDSPEPSFRLHVEQGGEILDTKVPVSLMSHQQWGGAAECSADGPKEGQMAEGSLDSTPPALLQKELQLRTREARLLGPVVLDCPQSLEPRDELQSSPAPERWSVLPKAEEEQEPGCSSNCGGDRDCISPESTASSHRSFEIGQTTSGIQSDSGLSSMGPSVHSQKMARAKWEFLFGPPSGDNVNAGSKDASTTPPSGTSSESPTPTPPNSLPLEGQRSANHDVQHVEVELVTPPPMATGASPKTGIIGRTIKYSETDLDAVPLRCYRETDIDELMADHDDADSAFGSNRSVPGTPGSSPLGGAAYERMDAEEQKQEEEEEQESLGWAGERRPEERKRLHNSEGEGEVFNTLLKRPMDGFYPGHPALKTPILVSGPRLAKEDSFSRHFESIMESHRAKGTSYSSLDSEDLLTSSGQSVYTFDLPTLTPEVQCQTYQSAREIVGLSFAPLARRETPSGSEDTLAALDSDATRAPSSERLSTCSEDTPSWGWYSALSPRERPPRAAVDSDLDRDLSELLGLGSTETLTNGSKADLEAAKRLAKRLYTRDGFRKSDVAKQLSKNNDFSRMVAEEYLHFFNFRCMPLDRALRAFLSEFALMGETQERERILAHFSRRYIYCNPNSSLSEDSAHTLTCALMLLNTDLHGRGNGKRMSCLQFIGNLEGLNDGRNFQKELLKALYNSIKNEKLQWTIDEEELRKSFSELADGRHSDSASCSMKKADGGGNTSQTSTLVYKAGFLVRKVHADSDGKRTPRGKRGWKTFYGVLKGLILYLQKGEFRPEKQLTDEDLKNAVSIHHSLAMRAADYSKRPNVFYLRTADWRVYLFQAPNAEQMQSWITRINTVAAMFSSPPLPAAIGSQKKFSRPLLPGNRSKLSEEEQMQSHETRFRASSSELAELQSYPPDRKVKGRELEEYRQREEYLEFEKTRYGTYMMLLRAKIRCGDEDLSVLESQILEDSGLQRAQSSPTLDVDSSLASNSKASSSKRNESQRHSYRQAVKK